MYKRQGLDSGVPIVERDHLSKKTLRNIRFRSLAWATKHWLKRANAARSHDSKKKDWKRPRRDAVISFPLSPFESYEGKTPLCRIEGDATLTLLERLAVRFSFAFETGMGDKVELSVDDTLASRQLCPRISNPID